MISPQHPMKVDSWLPVQALVQTLSQTWRNRVWLVLLLPVITFVPTAGLALPTPGTPSSVTRPPSPSGQPFSGSGTVMSPYRLGPGDQIQITVVDYKDFSGPHTVLTDGTISLPVVGNIPAANRTPEQFAVELTRRLRQYLRNPVVTVSILNVRPLLVNVAGEVQRPGLFQLKNFNPSGNNYDSNSPMEIPTINSALSAAGGVTRSADIRRVVLRRLTPEGEIKRTINLWDALFSENAPPSIILRDGDALFIPKLADGENLDSRLIARSSLAPKTVRVRVVGEVKKPGEVEVPPNSSISSAVAIAGGPTDKAQLRRVGFVRLGGDGKIERREIDLRNLTDTYQIQDGDVVIVPKSTTSSVLDFATPLFNPLGIFFNLLR